MTGQRSDNPRASAATPTEGRVVAFGAAWASVVPAALTGEESASDRPSQGVWDSKKETSRNTQH